MYLFTNQDVDIGKFKAPTLRNIAVTAPYMHDESIKTLEEVVDHYRAGGRTIKTGPNAGVGSENPNKSEFVKQIEMTAQEKTDLIAFLKSLTDEFLLADPRFSDPWTPAVTKPAPVKPRHTLHGEAVEVYIEDGTLTLYHDEVPDLFGRDESSVCHGVSSGEPGAA